jgi:hypothetical protein
MYKYCNELSIFVQFHQEMTALLAAAICERHKLQHGSDSISILYMNVYICTDNDPGLWIKSFLEKTIVFTNNLYWLYIVQQLTFRCLWKI